MRTPTRRAWRPQDRDDAGGLPVLQPEADVGAPQFADPVLGTRRGGPVGFRALARAIDGISDSVLSDRLAELTAAALVLRRVREGPPLSVTYALTPAGRALLPALAHITRWAERHLPA